MEDGTGNETVGTRMKRRLEEIVISEPSVLHRALVV